MEDCAGRLRSHLRRAVVLSGIALWKPVLRKSATGAIAGYGYVRWS